MEEKNKSFRMKAIGIIMMLLGFLSVAYGVFYSSGNSSFWTIYIGLTFFVSGLGLLGINLTGYPF